MGLREGGTTVPAKPPSPSFIPVEKLLILMELAMLAEVILVEDLQVLMMEVMVVVVVVAVEVLAALLMVVMVVVEVVAALLLPPVELVVVLVSATCLCGTC